MSPSRAARRVTALAVLLLSGSAPVAADGWIGARVRHLEPSPRIAVTAGAQVPILDYQPVPPVSDRSGRVWLADLKGSVHLYVPYLGLQDRWQLPEGLETAGVEAPGPDGRLFVTREGRLVRLSPGRTAPEWLADDLPVAHGRPCADGLRTVWTDAYGSAFVLGADGALVGRYEGDVFRNRPRRGGAVAACAGEGRVVLGLAGGKLVGLEDGEPAWTRDAPGAGGEEFATHSVTAGEHTLFCGRIHGCLLVDADGAVLARTETPTVDGPAQVATGVVLLAGRDGRVHQLALTGDRLERVQSVEVAAEPLWLLRPRRDQADFAGIAWALGSSGRLFRVDLESERSQAVYSFDSGASAGGLILARGGGLARSNFGTSVLFDLR